MSFVSVRLYVVTRLCCIQFEGRCLHISELRLIAWQSCQGHDSIVSIVHCSLSCHVTMLTVITWQQQTQESPTNQHWSCSHMTRVTWLETMAHTAEDGSVNVQKFSIVILCMERSGSGVELRTLDYENPGSNHGCGAKTFGRFFHSTLLQFTQLNKWVPGYRQLWLCVRATFAH